MKQKEKQQIMAMAASDLTAQIRDVKKQIATLALDKFTKPMKNVRTVTALRRKVAIMKTRLNDVSMAEAVKEK
jgi:ribosomal protein L29